MGTLKKVRTKCLINLTPESRAASRLGLIRAVCASLRRDHLKPRVDYWEREKAGDDHREGLRGLEGPSRLPESPNEEKARLSRSVCETEPISLIITSLRPPRNHHIIEAATKDNGGEPVRVRVRDNKNFMPGMEIRARASEEYPDVYVLVGRTPRYRGRW